MSPAPCQFNPYVLVMPCSGYLLVYDLKTLSEALNIDFQPNVAAAIVGITDRKHSIQRNYAFDIHRESQNYTTP